MSLSSGVFVLLNEYSLGMGNISLASPITLFPHVAGGDGSLGGGLVCVDVFMRVPLDVLLALYHLLR